jgi:hypothetical protein
MGLQAAQVKPVASLVVVQQQPKGTERMRILIAALVMCFAGCSSYDNGPLAYSKRGPIERAEPDADHNSLNADNQRQGLKLQNAEYSARTTPMLGPSR